MPEALKTLFNILVLVFVLSSMFDLGLGLTIKQIVTPLKKLSMIARALVANFILVPLLAYAVARIVGLDMELGIGLFILGVSAGSPMTIKLAQIAKGDMAYTAGLMILLQIVTILFAPLVLTLLLADIEIDTLSMVQAMVVTMLIPLIAGLFVKARYEELAQLLTPHIKQAATVTLMLQAVLGLFLGLGDFIGLLGTGVILALIIFVVLTLVIGYFLGGATHDTRIVTGLVTSQRNTSAALLITIQNFAEPPVIVMVITGAALMMVVGSLAAGESGKRATLAKSALESASINS